MYTLYSDDTVVLPEDDDGESAPKRPCLRSSIEGHVHNPWLCTWCKEPPDYKHPDRRKGINKFYRISSEDAWRSFKRHTITLEDQEMRKRINVLIESTSDPFASDIRYHEGCWMDFITHAPLTEAKHMKLQNVTLTEARNLFYRYIDTVIFEQHELRTLQSLLLDYKNIVRGHGYDVGDMKSDYPKKLLVREYKEKIGFQPPSVKNKSEMVYDTLAAADYVNYAVQSLGISDEQLVKNTVKRITKRIKESPEVPWPPTVDELEQGRD